MSLINQGGQYKSDSNITGAVGPSYQCIFNIFLFSKIYHVNNFLRQTGYVSLPDLSPFKGHIKELDMDLPKKAWLQVHSYSAPTSISQPVIVGVLPWPWVGKANDYIQGLKKYSKTESTFTPWRLRLRRRKQREFRVHWSYSTESNGSLVLKAEITLEGSSDRTFFFPRRSKTKSSNRNMVIWCKSVQRFTS